MPDVPPMRSDCQERRSFSRARACVLAMLILVAAAIASPTTLAARQHDAPATAEEPHEQTVLQTVAKLANFAILAGVLVYFLRTPVSAYLVSRATAIRSDLVAASELRATATAQLAEIDRKLQSLPAELAALKAQGAQDVIAEQARIAQAAGVERERLIQQTRREIDTRLRVARRELTEHAAHLAVQVAEERIRRTITPEDQLRLVERYTTQVREAR
jgi:F-type H+-transporting ATPase subunit b